MQKLELKEVSAGYGVEEVLHKISLKLIEPSIYVVLGPNGAGKTTLFRTICGILRPFSGQAKFDDLDLFNSKEARRRIAYLSHLNALPEEMTVFNTLKYYADIEGGDVEHVLDLLSLSDLRDKKFSSLSQGQKREFHAPGQHRRHVPTRPALRPLPHRVLTRWGGISQVSLTTTGLPPSTSAPWEAPPKDPELHSRTTPVLASR